MAKRKPADQELTSVEAGALRWKGVSAKKRSQQMTELAKKRAKSLTPEERSEIAAKAVKARWAKAKQAAKKKAD